MKFQVTASHLARVFPGLKLPNERLINQLNLDLGHLQLLRDAYQQWNGDEQFSGTGVKSDQFWLLLLALVDAVNQGSLCLDLNRESVQQQLRSLGLSQVEKWSESLNWSQFKLQQNSIIHYANSCLYFSKYHQLENQLQSALERLLKLYSGAQFDAEQVAQATRQVTDELSFEQVEDKQVLAIIISLLQPFSIISGGPGTGKTTIMSSVLRGLMLLGYQPEDVILAAPTGRAANRMTESLHQVLSQHITHPAVTDAGLLTIEAQTIHRMLGARAGWRGFKYGAQNHLNCKILVVDEVSMVDVALMRQLLQAIPLDCRIILLGDQFQLPSVDSGAVLADLMPPVGGADQYSQSQWQQLNVALQGFERKAAILEGLGQIEKPFMLTDHVTVLAVSKRSQPDIAKLSELIRQGNGEALFKSPHWQTLSDNWDSDKSALRSSGVYFIPTTNNHDHMAWQHYYLNWIKAHYFKQALQYKTLMGELEGFDESQIFKYQPQLDQVFTAISSNRILTLVNDSTVGSIQINSHITELMKQQLSVAGIDNRFHGSVIMLGKNNTALGLFNGDVAVLLAASNGQLRAVLPYKGAYRSHSIHVLPQFTSAYAMTVHKSQGSEFKHVLMALPEDQNHRLLSREIIYTGLTRAKQSVGIYAHEELLKIAVKRQTTRHSGLRFWYN